MNGAIALILAYLIGGVPFGYLLVRLKTGRDVRDLGSGNIGATNVLRTTGRGIGVVTLLLDIAKGFVAVWIAALLTGHSAEWTAAAAVAVMLGHGFPIFLKFRGGKAVASFVGAFLYLAPLALLVALLVLVVVVWRSRFISLGSITAAAVFPLAVWIVQHPPLAVLLAALCCSVFIIWRHHENIARLRAGKENVFSFGGKRP